LNSDRPHRALLLAAALLLVAACSPERDEATLFAPQDVGILVVDAVLIVGQSPAAIRLTRTQPPDVPYTLENAGVAGAAIAIACDEGTVYYNPVVEFPGLYTPGASDGWTIVAPETEYRLAVQTPAGERLTAVTRTPARLLVESWTLLDPDTGAPVRDLVTFPEAGDAIYDRPENQLPYATGIVDARFPASAAGVLAGAGYQLAIFSLDPDSDYVIDPPFFEDDDFEDLPRTGSSPALAGEGGSLRLPWFSIYFEGRHKYKVFVVDTNWFDLLRTSNYNTGGFGAGGTLGDGVERPLFHIEGGIGLFGSGSVDSVGFRVLPAP
jgi:hypothetical protein